ncbi:MULTISPECIES: S-methyl-5-thioribose kinase [Lachnospiraceae]|uniref:S-methyl-5-thioribose kinase n=1 Tax=Lachnospiraceae TaxID=186803 RepID=UPI00242D92C3|nr:S-methyl-5-thioribose kinase [Blautia massiliensis (ex Durand et al. 2017)]MDD6549074.1 S-methyl-5-thioribose kinase [Blautia massiliensis (ex Durand et al. 2017)]
MSDFSKYFLMINEDDPEGTEKTVIAYTLLKTQGTDAGKIDWDTATMKAKIPSEHGNLNHVCRVYDAKGHSIYIKQAGLETRISKDMTASLDRNRQESEILELEEKMAPGMVPHIYFFDTVMCASGMEDCSDFEVMRDAMLEHKTFPRFADDISTFMARTLLLSSDVVMDHKEKKELTRRFITPDLCDITEKLVLMEPYLGSSRNNVFPPNREFVEKELYSDDALHLEVSKLKFNFMTNAQALLHGDLHTGSVFIKPDATKIFDCEFGTFAPMGYDIGNVVANMIFAYDNGLSADDDVFCSWCLDTIEKTIDLFISKFSTLYDEAVTEPMAKVPGFKEYYIDSILRDTAGYAGTELHRRTVGMANVVDVTSIKDERKRLLAERINILAGKDYILHQGRFKTGKDFVDAVLNAREAAVKTL